jgi:multidrug efflux pump subunit AcrB
VNRQSANSYELNQKIKTDIMPTLQRQFPVQYEFSGANKDEKTTLNDMIIGAILAISLIYLILAGASQSYLWPLFVMISIPFGLAGAIFGHWILGIDITILSLFGFFGLAGIVVNDSIILLLKFKEHIAQSMPIREAITEASVCRFRAVTLTSLTTIAGLTPLLFERSLQAQFLIPMATSIVFGIATATVLILIVIPSMIELTLERWHQKIFKNGFHKPSQPDKENS